MGEHEMLAIGPSGDQLDEHALRGTVVAANPQRR
jgi:hypothetical protein